MSDVYCLGFETVGLCYLHLYSDEDPRWFADTSQTVPNSEIPDEHWHEVRSVTDDPWQQYHQLKTWADADTGFVRNVQLERRVAEAKWEAVDE